MVGVIYDNMRETKRQYLYANKTKEDEVRKTVIGYLYILQTDDEIIS